MCEMTDIKDMLIHLEFAGSNVQILARIAIGTLARASAEDTAG